MIWIVFLVLTAAVLAALAWPVLRPASDFGAAREAYDRAVFRDQLAELERDLARGAIGEKEAEAARNEISRRLIGATEAAGRSANRATPVMAVAALLVIPAVALPLYLRAGSPALPGVPLQARMDNAEEAGDFDAMLAKVELHLAANPTDIKGWQVLAPAYHRAGRYDDAARAYANVLRLAPPSGEALAAYGESLTLANQGLVTAEASGVFRQALKLDPGLPKARFYVALALKQEGKAEEARQAFETFLAESPAGAPWRPMLEAELAELASRPPALDQGAADAASAMSAEDQQRMIRAMVDGLDQKLAADGSDIDGWLRLIRARTVLGENDKASAAYRTAKSHFSGDAAALAALDALARELNVR